MTPDTLRPARRRWFQFGIGPMLLVVTAFALFLGWRVNHRRPLPPPSWKAADVKALIAYINGPKKSIGFIKNIQVPAADRLGDIGPPAKQYGAVEALTALIGNTGDAEAKEAAERALKRINSRD